MKQEQKRMESQAEAMNVATQAHGGRTPALGDDEARDFGRQSDSQEAPTGSLSEATAGGRKAVEAKAELRMGSIPHGDGEVGRSKEAT